MISFNLKSLENCFLTRDLCAAVRIAPNAIIDDHDAIKTAFTSRFIVNSIL